jgi:multidrug efflux system membrane fusion protein
MRRFLLLLLLAVAMGGGYYWYMRKGEESAQALKAADVGAPPVPVVTRLVEARSVPEELGTIGSVQPLAAVGIKARVDSVVQEVHFQEGQEVKAGDLLFTLDSRALEAQLGQAQAAMERDKANLERARSDLKRYNELVRSNTVARQQVDVAIADANAMEATVKADQAAVDAARVSLSFTRITAPMDGRTGIVTAKPGSSVRSADAEPLVTLTQLRPISVAFDLPERFLPAVRRAMSAGKLKVRAHIPGSDPSDGDGAVEGELYFVDSQVDQQSGTILVKALFTNEETRLWPGQFVNVVLTLRVEDQALTLPDTAVQTGQQGRYVYLVKPDNTVEMRAVTVSRSHDGLAVLSNGVAAGDRIVTEGQLRLFPGAKVAERADTSTGIDTGTEPAKGAGKGKGDGAAVGKTSGDEGKPANGSPA